MNNNESEWGGKKDTYSYRGNMNSDFFWKRAFAVYGHVLAAGVAVWIAITIVLALMGVK